MINTHNKIKVVHFERKSSYKAFSIERLFSDLRFESDHITKDIKIKKRNNIFPSRGFLFRLLDSLFASFYQKDINHITGDVHYLTYFLSKKKTILTIHDCGILENSKGFKFIFRWFFWFWLPNQCCEVITVISEPVKTNLLKFIKCKPSKIKVINNMVSPEFKPSLKIFNDTFPRILHIGLKENKNLLNHAKALKEINCLLVIIGKPSEKDIFILKENNINYEIHFDLSRKEVLEEYKKCDLLLFASTYEGFGLPILEAQAVGRPVLTSNISPINKIVGEGAYLVDPFDPFSIKEGILKIINDKKLRTFLINSGYENVQKYSAQKISRQYFSIYKSLYLKNKKKNLIIFSIKYAPGLFKEFTSIGEKISQLYNYKITYCLSNKYKSFLESSLKNSNSLTSSNFYFLFKSFSIKSMIIDSFLYFVKTKNILYDLFLLKNPNIVAIYNPHPLNYFVFALIKKLKLNCTTLFYLHEPFKPNKLSYGLFGYFYFYLVEVFQTVTLHQTDMVILPSRNALYLFKKRYPNFKGVFKVSNLLIPDKPYLASERKYFTIAGGMNKGKGLDEFFKLIEFSTKNNYDFKFRIVTTSKIDNYINKLSSKAKNFLLVENPKFISDDYMYKVHAESKAYFLLHSTATQSGAMAVAFMHGTPVIARDLLAFSQYISNLKNSYLVPKKVNSQDLIKGMIFISNNFEEISKNARETFEDNFSLNNFHSTYEDIFKNNISHHI